MARKLDETTAYAKAVVKGKILTCQHVKNACNRHLTDIEKGHERGLFFDVAAAQHILEFCREVLKLAGGEHEGQPFNPLPWQCFILGSLFGWKKTNGLRRFQRAYIETAKGSGKTPLLAAVGLSMLCLMGEMRAEIYSAATTKEQATILFNDAKAMVQQSPALVKRVTYTGGNHRPNLAHEESGSFFRPISSEDDKSGFRPYAALVDELHEHRTRQAVDMLERGFKGRQDPLLCMITNSGFDRTSICYEEHCAAVKVAAGDYENDLFFAIIYTIDEGDDPLNDERCWIKANPSLGHTIKHDYLRSAVKNAKMLAGAKSSVMRLNFSVWTDSETSWMDRKAWEAVEDEKLNIADFIGQKCWAGLDLSATQDITALALVFEDGVDSFGKPCYALFAHGFTPKQALKERSERDRAPYDIWVEQGHLTATFGKIVRYDAVAGKVVEWSQDYDLQALTYDSWSMQRFEDELTALNGNVALIQHPQGFNRSKESDLSMPSSIDMFERLILEGRLRVAVNPALRSAVMAAVFLNSPSGLRRFNKAKVTGRIDLCVASAMAIGAATSGNSASDGSYLDNNEILVLN